MSASPPAPTPPRDSSASRTIGARVHHWFLLYLAAMALLFFLPVPERFTRAAGRFDDLAHAAIFFGFSLLYQLDRRASPLRSLMVGVLAAGGIELLQRLLPFRGSQVTDFLAGAAGTAAGVGLGLLLWRRR